MLFEVPSNEPLNQSGMIAQPNLNGFMAVPLNNYQIRDQQNPIIPANMTYNIELPNNIEGAPVYVPMSTQVHQRLYPAL